jgi:hypothetical protein
MRYKIGDKVRYLNDVGGGVIVKIIDKNTVEISDESGFDIPIAVRDLVIVDSAENSLIEVKEDEDFEIENDEIILDDDFVSFDTKEETNEVKIFLAIIKNKNAFDLYIINDSSYFLFCNLIKPVEETFTNFYTDKIEPNIKIKIKSINENEIQNGISLISQVLFYKKNYTEIQSPIEKNIEIKALKFVKDASFKENDYFHEDAMLIDIFEYSLNNEIEKLSKEELQKIINEKQESDNYAKQLGQRFKTKQKHDLIEVDLHIQHLVDNHKTLSNSEIVEIQMERFHSELSDAIKNKAEKIVFIHGVGKGVLKNELRRSIERDYKKLRFQDASFKEYGFGATIIFI